MQFILPFAVVVTLPSVSSFVATIVPPDKPADEDFLLATVKLMKNVLHLT